MAFFVSRLSINDINVRTKLNHMTAHLYCEGVSSENETRKSEQANGRRHNGRKESFGKAAPREMQSQVKYPQPSPSNYGSKK
jgi:hypothetical protein